MPYQTEDTSALNEDVLAFVMRAERSESDAGVDRSRPDVLEVAAIWGDTVLDVKHYPRDTQQITLGSAMGHRLRVLGRPVAWVPPWIDRVSWAMGPAVETQQEWRDELYAPNELLPEPSFALVEREGDGFVLRIHEDWSGFVEIDGGRWSHRELIEGGHARFVGDRTWAIPLSAGRRALVQIGDLRYFLHNVPPGKRVIAAAQDRLDAPFLSTLAFTAFLGLMMGILVGTHPGTPDNALVTIPDRFAEVFIQTPEVEKQVASPDPTPAASAEKAPGEEGRAGEETASRRESRGDQQRMNQMQNDKEIAETSGLLGVMRDGGGLDGVFGSSGLSNSITGHLGGLSGPAGTRIGNGGLGDRGPGLGGGGEAGSLGGGMGTCSDGPGMCTGAASHGMGTGKTSGRITSDEPPILLGALDRAHIDAVIKRHMNQIRYCYQRELQKSPTLNGKLSVRFVIAGDGSVSAARTHKSSLGSPAVEECVNGRFFHFQFDAPKNGGTVIVTYPFLFSPG